jgi:outer membrane receptor protein involved in Fe transport
MRGISTGGDGQATTSLPSVGMYLDELPMTTIQGNIDVHMYDIARVEALAGPQGTLYGASSQSGTIRVITNKPDLSGFSANVSAQADLVDGDDTGGVIEGYVNIPIGDSAAVRLVGWSRSDAGWVDNVAGERVFYGVNNCAPGDNSCDADDIYQSTNGKDNYNTLDTTGARAALRVDLGENWTMTPTLMYQKSEGEGSWGDDLNDIGVAGKNAVRHTLPEFTEDEWAMLGLTIEGSIGNFDIVYSGSYLEREVDASFDYADYSYWYDAIYTTGYYSDLHFADDGQNANRAFPNYFVPNYFTTEEVGSRVMSGARYTNDDRYTKNNHEIRVSTDAEKSVRGMVGLFVQKQFHDFEQHWIVEGISPVTWMDQDNPGNEAFRDTVYLNSMYRTDRDNAIFGSVDFDIGDKTVLTVGARYFEPEVQVKGFFGFGETWSQGTQGSTFNLWSGTGELMCDLQEGDPGWTPSFNGRENWKDKPCLNVDKELKESDSVYRVNLTYDVSDDSMIYFTWSEGYRPGGVQRNPQAGFYVSDFLTNYEFGWKTQWADNTVQFNGALFHVEWDDFQVSFTGENAITAVNNGPTAHVDGIEADLLWLPSENLRISAAVAFYDTELQDDYCNFTAGVCTEVLAPKGTPLPITAEFKGNLVARYHFNIGTLDSYVQGAVAHNGDRLADMDLTVAPIIGELPAWTTLDLSAGVSRDSWAVDLFITNVTNEDAPLYKTAECTLETCGNQIYSIRHRPTTVSLRASFDFE